VARQGRPTSHARVRRVRWRVALVASMLIGGLLIWTGCSVEKHYEILSFFFDGVPNPNTGALSGRAPGASGRGGTGLAIVSAHSAYVEHRCDECHRGAGQFGLVAEGFGTLDAGVCVNCHTDLLDQYEVIHGPVAAVACLWCHRPHESPYEHLLAKPAPELCIQCHSLGVMDSPPIPEHMDLERSCLDCHIGHGSDNRYLLRASQRDANAEPVEDVEP
jgi:predicted CXXCH cytochrome family protein